MRFHNPKLFNQLQETSPIVTAPLTALVQVFHQYPHGTKVEL
jgi:hypothetical protein